LSWTSRAPAPTTLYEGQGAAVGGKLYVFGGFDKNVNGRPIATRVANVYDPAADRWTRLRNIPDLVTHAGVADDGQNIYLAGGFLGDHPGLQTNHVWRYDVAGDTWNALPPLPLARGAGALVLLGRELHYFGGVDRDARGSYLSDHGDHWVLNLDSAGSPGAGSWRTAAPMPSPRNHLAGAAMNGMIYAIGGQHLGDEANGNQSEVDVYDAATDTWRVVSPLPIPLGHITSSVFGWRGQIIVAGGVTAGERESAQVFAYDPATDRWSTLPALPGPRQSPVADVVGDALVVVTGATSAGPTNSTFVSR
ncbi:Kelch repeat-containing protein, partial [Deinococcus saxicola]